MKYEWFLIFNKSDKERGLNNWENSFSSNALNLSYPRELQSCSHLLPLSQEYPNIICLSSDYISVKTAKNSYADFRFIKSICRLKESFDVVLFNLKGFSM